MKNLSLTIFIIVAAIIAARAQTTAQFTSRDLVGTWSTGGMSMIGERNTVTGATTPSNGNTLTFTFYSNGRFEFTGYMQSTMYGCATTLFNDKQGKYSLSGEQLKLTLTKNFWRNTNSCSPASPKERNYILDPESYDIRTKVDEYGMLFVCLANDKGETCYRKKTE